MVGTDYTYIQVNKLNPGQKSPFSIMVDKIKVPDMAKYEVSLSWYNPDGSEEYIEDVQVTKDPQQKTSIIENIDEKSESENLPFFDRDTAEIENLGEDEGDKEEDEEEDEEENEEDDEDDYN
jgi:hypothetical protein